ncbi:Rieske 2Fe-2S domain-containing protein [Fibrella aquatilis]|uniref:Ferric reductase-like transmembrane domain-containing protein n=1 Tax=Fibrella aquatilis TaxID=2817059 RepID=A0A939K0C0_9BACT|nr:Rieske 2Fe-2S domain-containing protein [Fibrella aquatilis]MBO0932318.1 ferric reductase-like transmembrane domain-containing protein [Fibrella aquatilis]
MALHYSLISWNRQKRRYDRVMVGLMITYLLLFSTLQLILFPDVTAETVLIRATSTLAFLMLHVVLAIGPLCRLDTRFLPLLYNRRHLGVATFMVAAVHGVFSLVQFHSRGNVNPLVSLFSSERQYGSFAQLPFQPLGFFALLILLLMATTSHDIWLKTLGPRAWKTLHRCVYLAYVLLVMHVVLGILQQETAPAYALLLGVGVLTVTGLHLTAAFSNRRGRWLRPHSAEADGFVPVCKVADLAENRGKTVLVNGESIALFRYEGKLAAVSNRCRHQNGPLGEGKLIDGCITCPWHGYQYLPENGQSPPPFTETIETYAVRCVGTTVWVNPRPNPPGTPQPPALILPDNL